MTKALVTLLFISTSLFSISWQEASKKISDMSFEEYKAYKQTDEYKEAFKEFSDSSLYLPQIKYNAKQNIKIVTKGKGKKKQEYKHLIVNAVLTGKKMPTKDEADYLMSTLLDDTVEKNGKMDAITIFLKQPKGKNAVAKAEWWPKGHKLTPKSIEDKSTYVKDVTLIAKKWN
jgi:hypothetical protein